MRRSMQEYSRCDRITYFILQKSGGEIEKAAFLLYYNLYEIPYYYFRLPDECIGL